MLKIRHLAAAAVLGGSAMSAHAAEVLSPTVYGGYSFVSADDLRLSDDGNGFFVGTGIPLSEYWNIDFSSFHHNFKRDAPSSPNHWRENGFKLDALFYYSRNAAFSPYVGLGVGYLKMVLEDSNFDKDGVFYDAGVGMQTYPKMFNGKAGFTADVRYRWFDTDLPGGVSDTLGEVVARVGLVVPLGKVSLSEPVVPVAEPAPAEPQPAPAVTPMEAERRFEDVHFAFDRSDLNDTDRALLDSAATVINQLGEQYPRLRVKVDGHTDWVGTDGYNMALGERRANSVKLYLTRKGVPAEMIDTTSYGESKPVASNETAEGRAQNRRAEVRTTATE
ncbi:MAG: OmpA family protein [Nevskiales bacterium]|nr:OmpA family protein [Nevskiales bacterium]